MNLHHKNLTTQSKYAPTSPRIIMVLMLISAVTLSCSISYNPGKKKEGSPVPTDVPANINTTPAAEQLTPTPIASEKIGEIAVTRDGGVFRDNGVTIEVSGDAVEDGLTLEIDRLDFSAGDDSGAANGYRLKGALYNLTGSITVTLPLMATLPGDEGKNPSIFLGEKVFAPSAGGSVYVSRPVQTQVERTNGTISTVLNMAATGEQAVSAPGRAVGSPRPMHPVARLALRDPSVEMDFRQMRPPKVEQIFESEHFSVHNLQPAVPESNLKALLVILEKQRQLIEGLEFDFSTDKGKLLVSIGALDPDLHGEFHPGIFAGDLTINKAYLADEATFNQNKTNLTVTAAHELLHYAQWLYDLRDAFSRTFEPPATYSLDEATATWIEPLAAENPDYLPKTAFDNRDFVYSPILPPYADAATAKAVQQKGYGASLYLRYVTSKIGNWIIPQLYRFARAHSGTSSASVLDSVLNSYDLSFSDSYAAFIETLMSNPKAIAPGLESPTVTKVASVMAQFDLDPTRQDDYTMAFEESSQLAKMVSNNTPGKFKSGPAPVLGLNFAVGEASMDAFMVTVKESQPAVALYVNRAQPLKIDMSGAEGTLLLVFTQAGTDTPWQTAGGGAKRNQSLTVDGFGSTAKRVLVVPITASLDGYADEPPAPQTKDIHLDMSLPVEAQPAPTFDCGCMNAIEPIGTLKFTEPSIHDSLETAAYWQYKTVSNFTLTADQSGCQVTIELSRKVYKEDQYVFVENQVQDGPFCYYWALCNGKANNDQTGCPYQTQ